MGVSGSGLKDFPHWVEADVVVIGGGWQAGKQAGRRGGEAGGMWPQWVQGAGTTSSWETNPGSAVSSVVCCVSACLPGRGVWVEWGGGGRWGLGGGVIFTVVDWLACLFCRGALGLTLSDL